MAAHSRRLTNVLVRGIAALQSQGAPFCVVGGVAVSFLSEPRTTKDVDLAVSAKTELEADQIVLGMRSSGFLVRELFQRTNGALATVRLTLGVTPIRLDLLFSTSGLERRVVADAREQEIVKGVRAPVTQRPHLIVMKLIAARPKDFVDIHSLLDASSKGEVVRVATLLRDLPDEKRAAATRAWKKVMKDRKSHPSEFTKAPSRLRRLQGKSGRR